MPPEPVPPQPTTTVPVTDEFGNPDRDQLPSQIKEDPHHSDEKDLRSRRVRQVARRPIKEDPHHSDEKAKAIVLAVVYFLYAAFSLVFGTLVLIFRVSQLAAPGDRPYAQYALGCSMVNFTGVGLMIYGGVRFLLRWEIPSAVGVGCLIVGVVNAVVCFNALRPPGLRSELLTVLAWGGLVVWGGFAFLNFDLSSRTPPRSRAPASGTE